MQKSKGVSFKFNKGAKSKESGMQTELKDELYL
jgi:hypothetical protein